MKAKDVLFSLTLKGFIEKITPMFSLMIGIIGSIMLLAGLAMEHYSVASQFLYLFGCIFLLITAVSCELLYFTLLETILISGHGAIMLGFDPLLCIATPVLLSFQVVVYYFMIDKLKDKMLLVGLAGMTLLAVGFAIHNYIIYAVSAGLIAWYSFTLYLGGEPISLLWAIVNSCFSLAGMFNSYWYYIRKS